VPPGCRGLPGRPWRVVIVTTCTPPLVGGIERLALNLARGLQDTGCEVLIVGQFATAMRTLRQRFVAAEPERTLAVEGVTVRLLRPRWPWSLPGALVQGLLRLPLLWRLAIAVLARACAEPLDPLLRGADVVHYLGTGCEPLGFGARASAHRLGACFCVQPSIHPGRWGDRRIDGRLYRRADAVFSLSAAETAVLARLGVRAKRIVPVLGSIDPPVATDPTSFRQRHGVAGPLVLFLGRKTAEKGLVRLLLAWSAVRRAIPGACLAIVGPGRASRPPALWPDGVFELVDASPAEKNQALAACDLLCLPSLGEAYGMAVCEACSYGKAVVCCDLPALRETVGAARAGLLVEPQPGAIAHALIALLRDPAERAAMGERGRALVAPMTHARALARYRQAYADALSSMACLR